jgi:uncharacterized protein (TIGR03067 family)
MTAATRAALAAALLCPALAAGPDREAAARKEMARLQGTWQAVSYALGGKKASDEDLKKIQLIIGAAGKFRAVNEGKTFLAGTLTVDPAKDPKTMDITFAEPTKSKAALGIYKIEGDTLTICRSAPGRPRPTAFASPPDSGLTVMSYRRAKSR